jgi:hypothetical protein
MSAAIVTVNLEAAETYRIHHGIENPWGERTTPPPPKRKPRNDRVTRWEDLDLADPA